MVLLVVQPGSTWSKVVFRNEIIDPLIECVVDACVEVVFITTFLFLFFLFLFFLFFLFFFFRRGSGRGRGSWIGLLSFARKDGQRGGSCTIGLCERDGATTHAMGNDREVASNLFVCPVHLKADSVLYACL